MEYICEYCGNPYLPKRTDARYCSHTCRQTAYVLRKALSETHLSGASFEKEKKLSVRTDITVRTDNLSVNERKENPREEALSTKKNSEILVKTDNLIVNEQEKNPQAEELSVKEDTDIPIMTDKLSVKEEVGNPSNQDLAVNNLTPPVKNDAAKEREYKEHVSTYLEELADAINSRKQSNMLYEFFSQKIPAAIWVSERYRCLLECLLTFSEMREANVSDLKEVCNAFTDLMYSSHFKRLHVQYPYLEEIKKIRNQLRKTCIEAGPRICIKYRLSREQKQNFILSRFELSQFIRKKSFAELNFKE